jgi:hypothetical protein
LPPGLPTPPESGVDAIVVYDPMALPGQHYKTYVVDTGMYQGTLNDDAAVVINNAFTQIGNRGVVGLYQQLDCQTGVSIPSNCGLRGLGQSYSTAPGSPSMPGLRAVGAFPANTALVAFVAGKDTCDVRDLTIDANATADYAAQIDGDHGLWVGVTFSGAKKDSLWVTGQGQHFYGCNAVGGGASAAGRAVLFDCPDLTWMGGWWRNPGSGFPCAEWKSRCDGHVIVGVHSIGTGGTSNLFIVGSHILLNAMYIDGCGTNPPALVHVGAGASDIVLFGSQLRISEGTQAIPIFRLEAGPVIICGCQSYVAAGSTAVFSKVAEIPNVIRARFIGCDFAALQQGAPSIDSDFTLTGAPPRLESVVLGGTGVGATSADVGVGVSGTRIRSVSGASGLKDTDDAVIATGAGGYQISLDPGLVIIGKVYKIKTTGMNSLGVTLSGASGSRIDGATQYVLSGAWSWVVVVTDGPGQYPSANNWLILSKG